MPTATPTATTTPGGLGLFYLHQSYKDIDRYPDPATSGSLTNPYIQGTLWRETWALLDKNGQWQHDWTFLDACFRESNEHGKFAALQILAGASAPQWFFDLPGAKHLELTGVGWTTVPWDPMFQLLWEEVQTAMAARYGDNPNLKYVVLSGVGQASESFLVKSIEDQAAADALAQSMGYPDAVTAWKAGVKWLIDMYARVWHKPVVLVTGAPFPNGGTDALQEMFDYGNANHRGQFGCRADDLTANNPQDGQPSAEIIKQISPYSIASGYQFGNHQNVNDPNPPLRLGQALRRGIGFGAHYEELFADDADDPLSVPVLLEALTAMGLPTPAPSPTP